MFGTPEVTSNLSELRMDNSCEFDTDQEVCRCLNIYPFKSPSHKSNQLRFNYG